MEDRAADRAGLEELRARLHEAEETIRAIRSGEVDAVIVGGEAGEQVYTLRSADQPYRTLVEQMHEGAAILTVDGDILYCNRRFAELVLTPLEEVIGGSIGRFITADDQESFAALLSIGHGAHRGRVVVSGNGAREVYMSLTTTVADGVERRSLIVADLTELKDAQTGRSRAERENRAKDEFMAMLAHELRNPLGAISSATQVLEQVGRSEGPEARARSVITRQIRHLSYLIDDLLEASRVVTGKISLTRRAVDLGDLVHRCVANARDEGRLARHITVDAEPVWIDADPVRIEQIIGNLLANAVKFTSDGGRIDVRVTATDAQALLRVDDDGIGIEPQLLPRIFDLFVQGEATLNRERGGLGIGLTLVRRLAELHGGVATAASEGPQRGSSFTLQLPRIPAPGARSGESVPVQQPVRRRVLVVEDNPDAREMYRLVLELEGHEVLEAEDGAGGLDLLRAERPDFAMVDLGLPGLDGYEVARRFRAEAGADRSVLIALTGYGSREDRERSRQAGFDYHLVKPVSPDVLRKLLSGAVLRPAE